MSLLVDRRSLMRTLSRVLMLILCSATLLGLWVWGLAQEPAGVGTVKRLSKDEAIARVEELKGSVGIDGESDQQPVWMVDLSDQTITGADLSVLLSFPDLEVLNLAFTSVGDRDLADLVSLPKLRELNLSGTHVTDNAAATLVRCRSMKTLQLNETAFTDRGWELLAQHPALVEVSVEGTAVSERARTRWPFDRLKAVATGPTDTEQAKRNSEMGRLLLLGAHRDPKMQDRGIEQLERAVIAAPDNDDYKVDLADAYAILNLELTLGAAIDLYEDVLIRRPEDEQLWGQLAKAYTALENLEQAQAAIDRRLELIPPSGAFDVVTQCVGVVAAGGDRAWAVRLIRGAVKKSPDDPRTQLLLAGLLIEDRQSAEAGKIVKSVLAQCDPDHPLRAATEELLSALEDR
jgi:tetratricopeptide (TPR) repeat protein